MFASPSVKTTTVRRILALVVLSATTAFAPWPIRPDIAFAVDPPDMVRIIGGAFTMGRDGGNADERPAHRVTLGPFLIDRVPVTNAEFAAFLDAMGGTTNARGQNLFDGDDDDARIHKVEGQYRAVVIERGDMVYTVVGDARRDTLMQVAVQLPLPHRMPMTTRARTLADEVLDTFGFG